MRYRVLWTDRQGEGRWADMDARSEQAAIWGVASDMALMDGSAKYVDSWQHREDGHWVAANSRATTENSEQGEPNTVSDGN